MERFYPNHYDFRILFRILFAIENFVFYMPKNDLIYTLYV